MPIFFGSPPRATAQHFKPSESRHISAAPRWEGERSGGNRRQRSYRGQRREKGEGWYRAERGERGDRDKRGEKGEDSKKGERSEKVKE